MPSPRRPVPRRWHARVGCPRVTTRSTALADTSDGTPRCASRSDIDRVAVLFDCASRMPMSSPHRPRYRGRPRLGSYGAIGRRHFYLRCTLTDPRIRCYSRGLLLSVNLSLGTSGSVSQDRFRGRTARPPSRRRSAAGTLAHPPGRRAEPGSRTRSWRTSCSHSGPSCTSL